LTEHIPQFLREQKRWTAYSLKPKDTKPGKMDKVPNRSTAKPHTWEAFETASAKVSANHSAFAGVGYLLNPPHGVVAIDLDNCVSDGLAEPWAQEIVNDLASYTEVSPSGKGLHIFVQGSIDSDFTNHEIGIEVYGGQAPRFLTVTGQVYGELRDIVHPPPGALEALRERYKKNSASPIKVHALPYTPENTQIPEVDFSAVPSDCATFLQTGEHESSDRSGLLYRCAIALRDAGLTPEQNLAYLVASEYAFQVALDHRRQDADKAREYLWLHHVCPAATAPARVGSADDFDVIATAPGLSNAIEFINFADLEANPPPARRWLWQEWIALGCVTLLSGRGGHGKTLLAQQMATAVATGAGFLNVATTKGKTIALLSEDDSPELSRRQIKILAKAGVNSADVASALHIDARAGKSNLLVTFDQAHRPQRTQLLHALRAQCEAIKPVLVILDNAAQMFAGNEVARVEVTAFANELTAIAREFDCAVLLLGHTAKSEGSEYSGSTAWDAAVRARLYLSREPDGSTVLKKAKSNYSGLDELRLQYNDGVFELATESEIEASRLPELRYEIFQALKQLTRADKSASHRSAARNYILRQMNVAKTMQPMYVAALSTLIDNGELLTDAPLDWTASNRSRATGLAIAPGVDSATHPGVAVRGGADAAAFD
jgi:AAA domain